MHVMVGAATRPAVGQTVCGDAFVVAPYSAGTLVCLADGLGHGPLANDAAFAACNYAREHAGEPLEAIMRGIDGALRGGRGAAVSLLALSPLARRVRYAGVGNVELRAVAKVGIAPPNLPGIVGQRLRAVRIWEYPLAQGDVLMLASDGISTRFELKELVRLEPQALAAFVVHRHHKAHDDGSCVVARIEGDAA
jgi:phosphoserine phosphatase RsbX